MTFAALHVPGFRTILSLVSGNPAAEASITWFRDLLLYLARPTHGILRPRPLIRVARRRVLVAVDSEELR